MNRQTYFNMLAFLGLLMTFLPVWAEGEEERIVIVDDYGGFPVDGSVTSPDNITFPDCSKFDSTGHLHFSDQFTIALSATPYTEIRVNFRVEDNAGNLLSVTHPLGSANPFSLHFDLVGSATPPVNYSYNPALGGYYFTFTLPYSVALPANFPNDHEIHLKFKVKAKQAGGAIETIYDNGLVLTDICIPPTNTGGSGNEGEGGERSVEAISSSGEPFWASPNPFTSQFVVQRRGMQGALEMSLWTSEGRLVDHVKLASNDQAYTWEGSSLGKGFYYLKIENGTMAPQVKKIVKID